MLRSWRHVPATAEHPGSLQSQRPPLAHFYGILSFAPLLGTYYTLLFIHTNSTSVVPRYMAYFMTVATSIWTARGSAASAVIPLAVMVGASATRVRAQSCYFRYTSNAPAHSRRRAARALPMSSNDSPAMRRAAHLPLRLARPAAQGAILVAVVDVDSPYRFSQRSLSIQACLSISIGVVEHLSGYRQY